MKQICFQPWIAVTLQPRVGQPAVCPSHHTQTTWPMQLDPLIAKSALLMSRMPPHDDDPSVFVATRVVLLSGTSALL